MKYDNWAHPVYFNDTSWSRKLQTVVFDFTIAYVCYIDALGYLDHSPLVQPTIKGVAYFIFTIWGTTSLSMKLIDKKVMYQLNDIWLVTTSISSHASKVKV